MADITMCLGQNCPKRDKCLRATAKANRVQIYNNDFELDCRFNNYRNFIKGQEVKMTNADRIRNMSDEELADFFS